MLTRVRHDEENLRALDHSAKFSRFAENHAREDITHKPCNANPDQLWPTIGPVWASVMDNDLEVIRVLGIKVASQLGMLIPLGGHIADNTPLTVKIHHRRT